MLNIYQDNGYLNMEAIRNTKLPFIFCWGGRGVGKTYNALKDVIENKITFGFMRRKQSQLDMINKPEFSPLKSLNADNSWNYTICPITKYNGGIYDTEEIDGKQVAKGLPIGYTFALSTIANLRGFDGSDIETVIYDEFIPEQHERPMKEEVSAFKNAYETINRNRELKGKDPLQIISLANANGLANPIFIGLGLVAKAEKMVRNKQQYSIDNNRGILLVNCYDSIISEQKKNTALYKLSGDDEYSKMALNNLFIGENDRSNIVSRPIQEYKPLVAVGELCIYRHKSRSEYYVSTHISGTPQHFGYSDIELKRFRRAYYWLWDVYLCNNMKFDERICEILLTKYFS